MQTALKERGIDKLLDEAREDAKETDEIHMRPRCTPTRCDPSAPILTLQDLITRCSRLHSISTPPEQNPEPCGIPCGMNSKLRSNEFCMK